MEKRNTIKVGDSVKGFYYDSDGYHEYEAVVRDVMKGANKGWVTLSGTHTMGGNKGSRYTEMNYIGEDKGWIKKDGIWSRKEMSKGGTIENPYFKEYLSFLNW